MDRGRTWTVVEQLIGAEDWTNKIGTLAGCAGTAPLRLGEVFESDTRDVLVFAPNRILVVQPKSSRKVGLLAGLLAAAGRTSGLGTVTAIPKADVARFSVHRGIRGVFDSTGELATAVIEIRRGRTAGRIDFVVDPVAIPIGDIEENVARWLGQP
ncbi:hypothetical protein ACTI_51700 [Actinoplanes sp. OR16]|uniref:hypothetical protein n=1 Tax=Actinoplanes sp. OR16 TaxID=946334 RepID=UPI000F718F5A|nr:hypothetical protein [Actinoplanes sp. OR16]BBH68485.1 hypothetical protein ACTI_51700 [Actinoplanes sp. OR16]